MARRRLLTLLAASALLTGAFAGPAAALELTETVETTPVDVAAVVEDVAEVAATVLPTEAVEVAAPVVEAVAPAPATQPQAKPTPAAPAQPTASPAPAAEDDAIVAAGGVTTAPPIDFLISLGGSEQTPARGAATRLDTPAMTTVESTTDDVPAPQVAPAPIAAPAPAAASAPSVLAQAIDDLPEEGAPALALIALAALVAAGSGTLQTARVEATA